MKRALALSTLVAACSTHATTLPAHGEALFIVDTDLAVPTLAGRLRVDVYSEEGLWLESRDIGRSDPRDWPASFSVFSDDDTRPRLALVRLRTYPEGSVRRYEGERGVEHLPFAPPHVATSREELCATAPELPIGGRATLRQGEDPIDSHVIRPECPDPAVAGAVAARVTIERAGIYRFSIAGSSPYLNLATLSLRARCEDPSTQIACRTIRSQNGGLSTPGHLARFDATLEPGSYTVVATGALPEWSADTTLEVLPLDTDVSIPPPADPEAPPALPRLVVDGNDRTPETEPVPGASVERLVLVELVPGVRGSVRVTLRGVCAGTAAELGDRRDEVAPRSARSCTDAAGARATVAPAPLDPDLTRPIESVAGTFGPTEACPAGASDASRVCIPPGVFLFGSRLLLPNTVAIGASTPERIAVMPRFWMDRYEVSVARFRAAVVRGFVVDPDLITNNDEAFPNVTSVRDAPRYDAWCSWSTQPTGREDYPLSCIGWRLARAFCIAEGGDLPTEAEWEYAAVAAGRSFKALFPWGNDDPGCARGVFTRYFAELSGGARCDAVPLGPAPLSASDGSDGRLPDITPLGVVGLGGSVAEWTLDSAHSFTDACWQNAGLVSPRCDEEHAPNRTLRGLGWPDRAFPSTSRNVGPPAAPGRGVPGVLVADPSIGFRCVYREASR